MDVKQETPRFFGVDFIKKLPPTFPEKAEKIKDRLNLLNKFRTRVPMPAGLSIITNVCSGLLDCECLLEIIAEYHKFSYSKPNMRDVPKYHRNDQALLCATSAKMSHEIGYCVRGLKQCIGELPAKAKKKKEDDEKETETKKKSFRKAYKRSLNSNPKDKNSD